MWRKNIDVGNPDIEVDTWFRIFGSEGIADEETIPKPLADWKKSDVYKVISLKWSKGLAAQQFADYSCIILEHTKKLVRDRHTFGEARSKSERLAPTLSDRDREGKYLPKAETPRGFFNVVLGLKTPDRRRQETHITDWHNDAAVLDVATEGDMCYVLQERAPSAWLYL